MHAWKPIENLVWIERDSSGRYINRCQVSQFILYGAFQFLFHDLFPPHTHSLGSLVSLFARCLIYVIKHSSPRAPPTKVSDLCIFSKRDGANFALTCVLLTLCIMCMYVRSKTLDVRVCRVYINRIYTS